MVVKEVTGEVVLELLENGVSKWPAHEGRFPQVSGIQFLFDPDQPPGQRVRGDAVKIHGDPLDLTKTYKMVTTAYLAKGKDGYDRLASCPSLVDEENGPVLSIAVENQFETVQKIRGERTPRTRHAQNLIPRNVLRSLQAALAFASNCGSYKWQATSLDALVLKRIPSLVRSQTFTERYGQLGIWHGRSKATVYSPCGQPLLGWPPAGCRRFRACQALVML
jgi:hypothetical protein